MNAIKILVLSALVLLTSSLYLSAQSSGINFFHGSMEEAQEVAAEENKLIFVDAYTVWCGPCRYMSSKVFTHPTVGAFFNKHFVNVKLNMETPEGSTFRIIHAVNAYPTLMFLNENGEEFYRKKGVSHVDSFLSMGKQVVTQAKVRERMYVERGR